MKKVLLSLTLASMALAAVDLSKPLPALRLPDGRILKNAHVSTFRTMDVVIRHGGGAAVVRYEALPEEIRIEAEKKRPGGPRFFPGDTAANKTPVAGQVFITTRGAGAYKFSGVDVYAFPMEALDNWKHTASGPVQLPKPISHATTDADGKFQLYVPKDKPFFLFAQAQRQLSDGAMGRYEWRAPSNEFKRLDQVFLNSDWRHEPSAVKIEETP